MGIGDGEITCVDDRCERGCRSMGTRRVLRCSP